MSFLKKVSILVITLLLCFNYSLTAFAADPSYDENGQKYINIDSDDIVMLEKLVVAEAGNQSLDAKIAVATVVINRCLSERFPDTVYDVIHQKTVRNGKTVYQFSCVPDGHYEKAEVNSDAETAVLTALQKFMDGEAMLPRNVLYFRSDYYFDWATVEDYAQYDDMYFSALI